MPYNPDEPRDHRGRWTSGGETEADRYARTFYPAHPTDTEIRIKRAAGEPPPRPNRDISPEEGRKIVGQADKWGGTPYAPAGTPQAGPNAVRGKAGGGDCSGIVNKIYGESGHPYPYTASGDFIGQAQRGQLPFREVDPKDRQPGDVIVFDGGHHMAIYDKDGGMYTAHRAGSTPFNRQRVNDFGGRPRYFRYQDNSRQA